MWSSNEDDNNKKRAGQVDSKLPVADTTLPQLQELEFDEPTSDDDVVARTSCTTTNTRSKKVSVSALITKFLDRYGSYVSNSWNQDKLLKLLHYSLWMLSRFYAKSPHSQQGLSFLNSEILWARYVTRLLGWPTALQGVVANDGADKYRRLGKAMAWSMVLYYPTEALAYVKWKTPQMVAPSYGAEHRLAERASAWSCRAWVAYIVLDMIRSVQVLSASPVEKGEDEDADVLTPKQRTSERLQILRNALFLAPAVHWSLPNWDTQPWLSDTTCKVLLWLEAVVCMGQSISNLPPA
jgi:hypothetical protein